MVYRIRLPHTAAALFIFSALGSAEAAVYCKTVGVPKGCVVRPVAPVVVVTPAPVVVAPVVVAPRARVPALEPRELAWRLVASAIVADPSIVLDGAEGHSETPPDTR